MAVSVSILSLIKAEAEGLLPAWVGEHLGACLTYPYDAAPKGVFADRLDEDGEESLARALRWMAAHEKHPDHWTHTSHGKPVWEWSVSTNPKEAMCLPGYMTDGSVSGGSMSLYRGPSFLSCVAYVADRLDFLKAEMEKKIPSGANV